VGCREPGSLLCTVTKRMHLRLKASLLDSAQRPETGFRGVWPAPEPASPRARWSADAAGCHPALASKLEIRYVEKFRES
jgi:hypothetical protein